MLFVDFLEAKQNLGNVLESLIGGPEKLYSNTPSLLSPPVTALVTAANEAGEIDLAIEPLNLLRAIVGVATIRPSPVWRRQTEALIDLLLKGARIELPKERR
ncbi:hypothetical protein ACQKKX_15050 [Neorhizobium sp. NPDC001467]|uniref:hypothetical protein n=1 Tax=Neorhizobium sp. NPDC001467 TaxID=3390595 RepID=UPI003CFBF29E